MPIFTDFIKHLFPRVLLKRNLTISYTFCLGGLAFTALLLLLLTGGLLIFYYQPTPSSAYSSILFLEENVFGGKYLRSLHRMTSHIFILLLGLHTLRVVLTGAYQKPRQLNWVIGVLLLFAGVFEGYCGYLLPMDQLALWATQTGMELLGSLPLGGVIKTALTPDNVGGALSLLRFYGLHIVVIPVSIFALSFLHFYRIRKNKGALPYL